MFSNMPPMQQGMVLVPPKVAAAQEYLRFAEQVRNPPSGFDGMRGVEPRSLSIEEEVVYKSALEVLRLYFTGEQDFSVVASPMLPPNDGSDPRVPVTN